MKRYVAMINTDEDDRDITEAVLAETGMDISMKFLADANELYAAMGVEGAPLIILLNDTGAAYKGYDDLRQLRTDPSSSHIPVIVLGEVSTEDYIREYYRAGANSFVTKPSMVAETKKKMELFFNYWFNVAEC
ncbi:MAG: response regulator [Chitinophagaceae bacterium]